MEGNTESSQKDRKITETEESGIPEQGVDKAEKKMTFEELFSRVSERLKKADTESIPGRTAFEFHITDLDGVFYLEAGRGWINVEPYDYHDKNGVFTASAATYSALCEGSLTPVTAFAAGRLRVDGGADLIKTLEMLFSGK